MYNQQQRENQLYGGNPMMQDIEKQNDEHCQGSTLAVSKIIEHLERAYAQTECVYEELNQLKRYYAGDNYRALNGEIKVSIPQGCTQPSRALHQANIGVQMKVLLPALLSGLQSECDFYRQLSQSLVGNPNIP